MTQKEIRETRMRIEASIRSHTKSYNQKMQLLNQELLNLQKKCKHPNVKSQPGPETEHFCPDCKWYGKSLIKQPVDDPEEFGDKKEPGPLSDEPDNP